MRTYTAYILWDPKTEQYVGIVPGINGAHTQGDSLDELNKNLKEVLELCLEETPDSFNEPPLFIGIKQVQIET